MYRSGLAAEFLMLAADVVVAMALLVVFESVSRISSAAKATPSSEISDHTTLRAHRPVHHLVESATLRRATSATATYAT
jgi:hypothetical protein